MAETKTASAGTPEKPATPEPSAQPAELVEGASSTDPAVHRLLALRYAASMNNEKDVEADVTAQLAELGWK